MLQKNLWLRHEPRFQFPIFKDVKTLVSFSIRPDFNPLKYSRIPHVLGYSMLRVGKGSLLKSIKAVSSDISEYGSLLFSKDSGKLKFRLAITNRHGKLLGVHLFDKSYPPGGSIDVNVTNIISDLKLPNDDYMGILIMTRGRTDGFRSSPGSYSMTYYNDKVYTTYRTGGFARVLNDPNKKDHFGFRGINPKVIVNDKVTSSILLINHSSDPLYDTTANPKSTLIRADGKTRKADFGSIPPFGGIERSMEDLFGDDVAKFLEPFGGKGTTVTECQGISLASIHLRRARDGSSMSIEHSRPTHTYLLHGGD